MNTSIILAVFALISIGFCQADDSRDACDTQAKCLQEAYNVRQSCDNITATIAAKWPSTAKLTEAQQTIADLIVSYNQMTNVKRLDKIQCLQANLDKTVIVTCDPIRKANCSDWVAAYKPRSKRQAPAPVPAPPAAANTTHAPTMATTKLSAAEVAAEKAAKAAAAAAAAKAKQEAAAAAAAAAAADRALRTQLQNSLNDCNKKVSEIEAQCNIVAQCCSESVICDWSYQAKPEFTAYVQVQSKLQLARRTTVCPTPAPPTTTTTKAPPTTTTAKAA